MHAGELFLADLGLYPAHQPLDLRGVRVAGRVRQPHLPATRLNQRMGQFQHLAFGHRPFHRAAECGGDSGLENRAALLGKFVQHLVDAADFLKHFGVVLAHVRLAVRLAGRNRDAHLVRAGGDRPFHALEVRRQGGDVQPRDGHGVTHELLAVGHLRQQFGRHEGADFDFGHACGGLGPDPGLLGLGGHDHVEALQAVARPHLAYENVNGHMALLPGPVDRP